MYRHLSLSLCVFSSSVCFLTSLPSFVWEAVVIRHKRWWEGRLLIISFNYPQCTKRPKLTPISPEIAMNISEGRASPLFVTQVQYCSRLISHVFYSVVNTLRSVANMPTAVIWCTQEHTLLYNNVNTETHDKMWSILNKTYSWFSLMMLLDNYRCINIQHLADTNNRL